MINIPLKNIAKESFFTKVLLLCMNEVQLLNCVLRIKWREKWYKAARQGKYI